MDLTENTKKWIEKATFYYYYEIALNNRYPVDRKKNQNIYEFESVNVDDIKSDTIDIISDRIGLLNNFMILDDSGNDWGKNLNELASEDILSACKHLESQLKLERFLRCLNNILYTVKPDRFPFLSESDEEENRKMLGDLYKRFGLKRYAAKNNNGTQDVSQIGLEKSDETFKRKFGIRTPSERIETLSLNKIREFHTLAYFHRNKSAHSIVNPSEEDFRYFTLNLSATLCTVLDVLNKNKDLLNECLQEKDLNYFLNKENLELIVSEYEKSGIFHEYVDLDILKDGDSNLVETINGMSGNKIQIFGVAGTGKTTFLKRIEYKLAKGILEEKKDYKYPVYIELKSISKETTIKNEISKILDIPDIEIVNKFLVGGNLCLIFDGFNEILDNEISRNVKNEIVSLAANYKDTQIIISNRNKAIFGGIDQNVEIKKGLSFEIQKEFVQAICKDPQVKENLLKRIECKDSDLYKFDTAIKMFNLIKIFEEDGVFPEDFEQRYIEHLINRENEEKGDNRARYISNILPAVAKYITDNPLNSGPVDENKLLKVIGETLNGIGALTSDSKDYLELMCALGILVIDNDKHYEFADDDVRFKYLGFVEE